MDSVSTQPKSVCLSMKKRKRFIETLWERLPPEVAQTVVHKLDEVFPTKK